jgi:hypothetical protein
MSMHTNDPLRSARQRDLSGCLLMLGTLLVGMALGATLVYLVMSR